MAIGGVGKFGVPAVLAAINVAFVGLWFGLLDPQLSEIARRSKTLQNMSTGIRNAHDLAAKEFAHMEQNRDRFEDLLDRGFISPQDRLGAARLLEELRETHALSSIQYKIEPERVAGDRALRKASFQMVSTKITVTMEAMFDAYIIDFTQAVVERFPGQVRLHSLTLQQIAQPTEATLDALRNGELVDFAGGELVFEWNTLRPIEKKQQGQSS